MNGESTWKRYLDAAEPAIRRRAVRLNAKLRWPKEPSLDATERVDEMANDAERFQYSAQLDQSQFAVSNGATSDVLLETALQLRASLIYFHLDSVETVAARDIAVIKGHILCRLILLEQNDAFERLMEMTSGFSVDGAEPVAVRRTPDNNSLQVPITITRKLDDNKIPIRIDAIFRGSSIEASSEIKVDRSVSISGFPVRFQVTKASAPKWVSTFEADLSIRI